MLSFSIRSLIRLPVFHIFIFPFSVSCETVYALASSILDIKDGIKMLDHWGHCRIFLYCTFPNVLSNFLLNFPNDEAPLVPWRD